MDDLERSIQKRIDANSHYREMLENAVRRQRADDRDYIERSTDGLEDLNAEMAGKHPELPDLIAAAIEQRRARRQGLPPTIKP